MGSPKSSFKEKVAWLVRHPDLWRGWPAAPHPDDFIIGRMRLDGLISEGSNDYDIMDFGKLIAEARSQMRKQ